MANDSKIVVGVLRLRMLVRASRSLKDKRQVLKGLKDRLRNKYNISVAEIGSLDNRQIFELGITAAGNDRRYINGLLSQVVNTVSAQFEAELLDYDLELF
jgi:uncharacterized protein